MGSSEAQWIHSVPHSRMTYPENLLDQVKYWFWRIYTPLHPYVRDISLMLGLVRHDGRQDFLIGKLDPSRPFREFISYLVEQQGFGNHFIAWKDTDEVVSLRRTDGFRFQYHVRIFTDGEVRCHYEYTPEYRPIRHLIQMGFEERATEFNAMLQDWVVPVKDTLKFSNCHGSSASNSSGKSVPRP